MEKRIALEKRGREANQIKELNLDNCRSSTIDGLTDEFAALEKLSLINVGLVSLKNFPKLPSLKKLELSDNRISNGLSHLITSPKLAILNLSGNRIKDFEELKPLANLKNLDVLDLFNNEVTQTDQYRDKVFDLIPSLKYLDGFDAEDGEAPSDDEINPDGNGNLGDYDDDDDDEDDEEEDDDDESDQDVFTINGIEIDLKGLEELEKRVAAKKANKSDTDNNIEKLNKQFDNTLVLSEPSSKPTNIERPSLAVSYLIIMALFSILNQIFYKQTELMQKHLDQDEDDGQPGLVDVFNDDLEDDNSDYNEEDEVDEDDDIGEDEDGEGEEDEEAKASGEEEVEEESPTQGKKRKHDEND